MSLAGNAYRHSLFYLIALLSFFSSGFAQGSPPKPVSSAASISSSYVPLAVKCPSTPLVRKAEGLSSREASYIAARKRVASKALGEWLKQTDPGFGVSDMPTVALASSGGGYRAMISGAGIVQAFDNRDNKVATKGLYQGLTYHAGLSGGSWMLSSLIGNDNEPVKSLSSLWEATLLKNSIWPENTASAPEFAQVKKDMIAKNAAGYPPTTTDAWGRFFSYQLFRGRDGGGAKSLSSIANNPSFVNFSQPYPIITALGITNINGPVCDAQDNATQYEFHPYEFGSWEKGVEAFTPTETLGSRISNGKAVQSNQCVGNFDNLGYILGTSSNRFNEGCGTAAISAIASGLDPIIQSIHNATRRDLFAPYPNPFKKNPGSPMVSQADELYLVDGGQCNGHPSIHPPFLLHPNMKNSG
jgi:lysophospholipase